MPLGTMSNIHAAGAMPSAPTFHDRVSFLGDSAYPTGGSPGFRDLFRKVAKDGRAPIAVIVEAAGGYRCSYDVAADKLMVFAGAAGAGPDVEVANGTNLSAITFKLVVVSQ